MLFDDFQRTNGNPTEHGEPLYTFLNRAAGKNWQSVRDVLMEWLSDYPVGEQPTLISRFRGNDQRGFLAAFWELYLHELFGRLGFQLELHPEVAGTTRRPDFRLQRGMAVIYVEAVSLFEPQAHSIDDARLAPVLDAIDRISSPQFLVTVDARQIASSALPLKRLTREIESWLGRLDSKSESRSAETPASVFRWQEDGWMLLFRPIRRSAEVKGTVGGRNIEIGPIRTRIVDDSRAIRQRLGEKSRVYGRQFDQPYLIALTSYRPSLGPEAVLRGLFGSAWTHPEMMRDGVIRRSPATSSNGYWLTTKGIQYRNVSAVLTALELMPWSIARSQPWVIANPWASHPLEIDLPFNRFNINETTGKIEPVETDFEPHRHFSLPRDWPSGDKCSGESDGRASR